MFDHDDMFLVETYESIVSKLPKKLITQSKTNGSYYDFHVKTDEYIIVPKKINFTFKYVHLIEKMDPVYWNKLVNGWNKVISDKFGDPLDATNQKHINEHFDKLIDEDYYDILPPLIDRDDNFLYFKNVEKECLPANISVTTASLFHKMYENTVVHSWNKDVDVFLFPVNNTCFYGIQDKKLLMIYPKWNSFRWSYEIPRFIINTQHPNKIIKFKQFDVEKEQISIRMMNGMPNKQLFL